MVLQEFEDPFQRVCLKPWDDLAAEASADASSTSSTTSSTATGQLQCSASTASSCHDDGLISSCDPAATDFLLFALALHDQQATGGFFEPPPQQTTAPPTAAAAAAEQAQTHKATPAAVLTRAFAGALDTMLSSDCDCNGLHGRNDAAHKQPRKHSTAGAAGNPHQQLRDSAHARM